MKVLLDTNVILDVWLARDPFWQDSAAVLALVENKQVEGYICPTTATTLHYLGKKVLGEKRARALLGQLLAICNVGEISKEVLDHALGSEMNDFEDAVLDAVAIKNELDLIVTRNIKDFKRSEITAKEPFEIV